MHRPDTGSLSPGAHVSAGEQTQLAYVLMRGGTSKAVFLRGSTLPIDESDREATILALFGSPDPRQIDGLGGADLLTSKLAIIDPPTRPDADIDYTFAQISITEPVVDFDINCGNISAAVGAYAVDESLVAVEEPITTVRIHNTNTGRILLAEVPIVDGAAAIAGSLSIHGVPGTGAPIALDFSETGGGITGSLLPTGNPSDLVETSIGPVEISIIDLANLTVFFAADSVGMTGTEAPSEISDQQLESIEAVKQAAASLLGMPSNGLTPVPAIVAGPAPYVSYATGGRVESEDVDLVARVVGGRPPVAHKAYPGTLAACTGVAARIVGTTVHKVTRPDRVDQGEIRIGHPSGVMPVRAAATQDRGVWRSEQAVYHRTARRLAEGSAFILRSAVGDRAGS